MITQLESRLTDQTSSLEPVYITLSVCLSVCLSACLSVCLSVCLLVTSVYLAKVAGPIVMSSGA